LKFKKKKKVGTYMMDGWMDGWSSSMFNYISFFGDLKFLKQVDGIDYKKELIFSILLY
jgi:hypothetical protein